MLVRYKWQSDGKCFAKLKDGCAVLSEQIKGCGSYLCGFYKPNGCKDWVRVERSMMVVMLEPDEYEKGETHVENANDKALNDALAR